MMVPPLSLAQMEMDHPAGLGWDFGFFGASAVVLECYGNGDNRRTEAFNDFLIFAVMVVGSFLSGWILARHGWHIVLWFVPMTLAMAALLGPPEGRWSGADRVHTQQHGAH